MKLTKPKPLKLTQPTKTLSATFFSEQIPQGEDAVFNAIKNTSPTDLIVIAIKHQGNNGKKDHYHLIAKDPDNNGSFVVKSVLAKLNVQYRPDKDMALLSGRGLETTGSFSSCLSYILHKSYSAQRLGKKEYAISDLIANIPDDEIQSILDGYTPASTKLSSEDLIDAARNAGYNLEDFDKTLENMNIRGLTERMERTMRNAYFAGAEKLVRNHHTIDRLCIELIYTRDQYRQIIFAILKALSGLQIVLVKNSNESISISPATNALLVQRLNFFKEYEDKLTAQQVELIKGKGDFDIVDKKAIWGGDHLIIIKSDKSDTPSSRACFRCSLKDDKLYCDTPPSSFLLNHKNLYSIKEKYKHFKELFDNALANYSNDSNIDYHVDTSEIFSDIND